MRVLSLEIGPAIYEFELIDLCACFFKKKFSKGKIIHVYIWWENWKAKSSSLFVGLFLYIYVTFVLFN